MSFIVDKQTLDDLNIFGKRGGLSVYALFNKTYTRGGAQVLEEMFRNPLADAGEIHKREIIIEYFRTLGVAFPFQGDLLDAIEYYLSNTDIRSKLSAEDNTLQRKLRSYIGADIEYEILHKGILACIELIQLLRNFLEAVEIGKCEVYRNEVDEIVQFLSADELKWVYQEKIGKRLDYNKAADYDRLFRYTWPDKTVRLLRFIYHLDVYISVAKVAEKYNFVPARIASSTEGEIKIEGMFHPLLQHPVDNNLTIDAENNVVFLTGANMAGKSTFMKTFGICIFLAHMGFPVPCQKMEFPVQNGLFTTINLPDNLNMGYSHFYAEVLRVKKVALEVVHSERLVVIFDELFRGTNVKDAYEATVAIIRAFAEKRNCTFIISTHIIEAGEVLKECCDHIRYVYLPTRLVDGKPVYTYKLVPGITNDRHGMMIIENEHILELLNQGFKL